MITTKRTKITKKGISRKAAKVAKKSYGYFVGNTRLELFESWNR